MEKSLAQAVFRRLFKKGQLTVHYWDGTTETYGHGEPKLALKIKTPRVVRQIVRRGSVGVGEAYMNGDMEIEGDIALLVKLMSDNTPNLPLIRSFQKFQRPQKNTRQTQTRQIQSHYDIGNDFYDLWLDKKYRAYSCAYFETGKETLEQAQGKKIALILRKLELTPGQTLLDIGCGWGGLLLTAAQDYDITGLGVTLSQEQLDYCGAQAKKLGLDHKLRFELWNYQDLPEHGEKFDRIVSVGMFEHVGRGNQAVYFDVIKQLLKPDGLSVLHTISQLHESPLDPWYDRYIFPGAYIPSYRGVVHQITEHGFELVHYENLRKHYAQTLLEWWRRFENHLDDIRALGYDERFIRMERFYLCTSRGAFAYGGGSLSQFVFRNRGHDEAMTHYYGPLGKN